jgi:UDP-glucuronate decarboxylase
MLCVDNFFNGTRATITHLLGHPPFELLRHDITFPLYGQVDAIYCRTVTNGTAPTRSG